MEKLSKVKIYVDDQLKNDSDIWFFDGQLLRSLTNYNKTRSFINSKVEYVCDMLLSIKTEYIHNKSSLINSNANINNELITLGAYYKFASGPAKGRMCKYVGCIKGESFNGVVIRRNRFTFNYLDDNLEPLPKTEVVENHKIYPSIYLYTNGYTNMFTVNLDQFKKLMKKDNAPA